MLKLALSLLAGFLLLSSPAHAELSQVQGVFVHRLATDSLTICLRDDDTIFCPTLLTRAPDTEGFCSAAVMRNIIAITKSERMSDPIPEAGFVGVDVFSAHLKKNRISAFSGEFFPCADNGLSFFEGAFCADTSLRDGVYEYDHCILAFGNVTVTPAADAVSHMAVSNVTKTSFKLCEELQDNRTDCYRLEEETIGPAFCEFSPYTNWQPFSRFIKFMSIAAKQKEMIHLGAVPCGTNRQSITACVLKDESAEDWLFCSAVRVFPANTDTD